MSVWWPNVEPIGPDEYRNQNPLESAVARPFQTAFGEPIYRSISEKAAALFHSLIADHPFANGNKRTAVIALDLFLNANSLFLYLDDEQMYRLAKDTASYVPKGIPHQQMLARITEAVRGKSIAFADMKEGSMARLVDELLKMQRRIRRHPYNRNSPLNARKGQ